MIKNRILYVLVMLAISNIHSMKNLKEMSLALPKQKSHYSIKNYFTPLQTNIFQSAQKKLINSHDIKVKQSLLLNLHNRNQYLPCTIGLLAAVKAEVIADAFGIAIPGLDTAIKVLVTVGTATIAYLKKNDDDEDPRIIIQNIIPSPEKISEEEQNQCKNSCCKGSQQDPLEERVKYLNNVEGVQYNYALALTRLMTEFKEPSPPLVDHPICDKPFIDKIYTPSELVSMRLCGVTTPILTVDTEGKIYLDGDWTTRVTFDKYGIVIKREPCPNPIHSHKHSFEVPEKEKIKEEKEEEPAEGGSCGGGGAGGPDPEDDKNPFKKFFKSSLFKKALDYACSENKLNHIFDNKGNNKHDHNLDELLREFGGKTGDEKKDIAAQKELMGKVLEEVCKSGNLPGPGEVRDINININGVPLVARVFMDSIIRISTLFKG